jgi:hypothetical protein
MMTFVVNELGQVVRGSNTLQALAGDEVQVKDVTTCPAHPVGSEQS